MITLLLIIIVPLIAFIESIQEAIREESIMSQTYFAKFIGNKWIDPRVSWPNKWVKYWIVQIIWEPFSDLHHLCRFLSRVLWIGLAIVYFHSFVYPGSLLMGAYWWAVYSASFNAFRKYWIWLKL